MNANVALGVITLLGALVLVGRPLLLRWRRGEPIGRLATIWAGIFALAFAVALILDRRT